MSEGSHPIGWTPATPGERRDARLAKIARLTERQQQLYRFIAEHKSAQDGNSPSTEEMMAATGITSKSVMRFNLRRLQTEGLIQVGPGARNIRMVGSHWSPPIS